MATNNKPENRLRCGNIKATIWQNAARRVRSSQRLFLGRSRSVRDVAQWNLVRSHDLEALTTVMREAKEWIAAHALKR